MMCNIGGRFLSKAVRKALAEGKTEALYAAPGSIFPGGDAVHLSGLPTLRWL
ncbi:hypothetical protein DET57_1322 [Klebsiella oxytoca]|uniref:Uncharacterized protein n=1 Tax=Klebsiella oxytoca TaxID=571 RepID=A0A318F645_KLEOX|nr:hypothetical protein [Klebsiella oxytoca]PXW34843.1 hypothetical protein DET57_1322 [Klebsiella oxytoca]HCB1502255.1 hypothetical protein [Klebsiella michiganensis]HCB1848582.1 hypothetical protein [Klebsiella oxytoca]